MYVVIQKLKHKKVNSKGSSKFIKTYSYIDFNGETAYGYRHSEECFERTNTTAYKISIRKSYREKGRVKQQQWSLFTVSYYDLLEFGLEDFIRDSKVDLIVKESGISTAEFWDMVYKKVTPLVERIRLEYEATDEYKAKCKNDKEIREYFERECKFREEYGECFYNHIYDFYGNLMNQELLEQVKLDKKVRDEYYKYYQNKSSYQRDSYSNYYNKSGYQESNCSNYSDSDKKILKKIYKAVAAKFHPDNGTTGSEEVMLMLNRLKEDWGV